MADWTKNTVFLWAYELVRRYGELISYTTAVFAVGFYIGVITTNG